MNSLKFVNKLFSVQPCKLNYLNKYSFGMKTSARTIIYGQKPVDNIPFTREYFKLRSENPQYEKEQKLREQQEKQKELNELFYKQKYNDTNAQNIIPVIVNREFVGKTAKIRQNRQFNLDQTELARTSDKPLHPFITIIKPKEPLITVTGIRRNVPSTVRKLKLPMRVIGNLQIYDAMSVVEQLPTKAAKYVLLALKQVLRHAEQKDMDPNRLYVQSAITGKQRRFKLLYYKAKAQSGLVKKDICQLRITLYEKPIKDLYKDIIVGKTPPSLAFILRQKLQNSQASYEKLRKWQFVLTAKGRQQRRLMFKRRVIQKQQEYQKYGVKITRRVISKKLLEVEAQEWSSQYEQSRLEIDQESINRRMAIYQKNEDTTGFN